MITDKRTQEEHEALVKIKRANFINEEIQDLYWIHLVTCWKCGSIEIIKPMSTHVTCQSCFAYDEACHFPDLFY